MKGNKFIDFLKNNLGLLIGLLIGALVVLLKWSIFFINAAVIVFFGLIGLYMQRNRAKVKSVFTNLLKNIVAKMED